MKSEKYENRKKKYDRAFSCEQFLTLIENDKTVSLKKILLTEPILLLKAGQEREQ